MKKENKQKKNKNEYYANQWGPENSISYNEKTGKPLSPPKSPDNN